MSKTKTKTKTTQKSPESQELFADTNITMKSGHLVRDAKIVSEGRYAKIRIATNKQYKTSDGEIKTITNYFNALVSSNLKDAFAIAQNLKKGDWAYVKGEDITKSFDTPEGYKQTGSTIFAYKVALKKAKAAAGNQDHPAPVITS